MKRWRRPYGWWGGHEWLARPMSIVELILAGTLDTRLAALLWLAVDRKASLILASEPPMAGKTTLLTALIDLLPPHYEVVYTWGWREDFAWLRETDPAHTYIMVNEISDHLPTYLWGPPVRRVFEALAHGYSLGATMHATSPREVWEQLTAPPVEVGADLLARVHLLGFLDVIYGSGGVVRRLVCLHLVLPPSPGGRYPPTLPIASWDARGETFLLALDGSPGEALAQRLGLSPSTLRMEMGERSALLGRLARDHIVERAAVRCSILSYHQRS
jgi:flagellar protein FlaI